jgi:hypothetical protein
VAYGRRETQETAGKLHKHIKMTAIAASGKQVTLPDRAKKDKPPSGLRRLQSLMRKGLHGDWQGAQSVVSRPFQMA